MILNEYLPYAPNINTVFRVSAVADTFNGKPKQNFTSIGLNELITWMLKGMGPDGMWLKIKKIIARLLSKRKKRK